MNLLDSSFLCLDIGSSSVKGLGVRISSGGISSSKIQTFESPDTGFAIKQVVDMLESALDVRFDSAYVTGNFGSTELKIIQRSVDWGKEHKVAGLDISVMISDIPEIDSEFFPLHIIPLRYDFGDFANIATPVGQLGKRLSALFGVISASREGMADMRERLRAAHIMGLEYSDPAFLLATSVRQRKESSVLVDLGASSTSVAVWTARGPMFMEKIPMGQNMLTDAIASGIGLSWSIAEYIKRKNISMFLGEMDRFTPASTKHEFSRADVVELALPVLDEIIKRACAVIAPAAEKYRATKLYLSGGGANIPGIETILENEFGIPVENIGANAVVQACAAGIWCQIKPRADALAARRRARGRTLEAIWVAITKLFKCRKKLVFLPIMPSTLAFNMRDGATYARFKTAHISMVHVDIMDGLFVDKIYGGIDELKYIRAHTRAHLNVHLMTETPRSWAAQAVAAGADTITISAESQGARTALAEIKSLGKRVGIALWPSTELSILKPVLREIDEVLVMSIPTGEGGLEFMPEALARIKTLVATRKKYGLKFKISVDGGINETTAQLCWRAGVDFIVSGSYLAKAADFPVAVQSLLRKN